MTARRRHLDLPVFLASPGDVPEEPTAVRELMENVFPKDRLLPVSVSSNVVARDHPAATMPMPNRLTPQEAVIWFDGRPADCDIVPVIPRRNRGGGRRAGRRRSQADTVAATLVRPTAIEEVTMLNADRPIPFTPGPGV
jgi:hypothetical protein